MAQPNVVTFSDMINRCGDALRPPERLTVSQATEKYRHLNNPGSYVGPWKNSTVPYLVEVMDILNSREFNSTILVAPAQCGKALALDTPIRTVNGWSTMGELVVGDTIFDENGKPCRVVFATEVMTDHLCYRVSFDEGSEIVADADHKWFVDDQWGESRVLTTRDMLHSYQIRTKKGVRNRFSIPNTAPLTLDDTPLPIDPYLFGLWLGDGSSYRAHLSAEETDARFYERELANRGITTVLTDGDTCWTLNFSPIRSREDRYCVRGHDKKQTGRTPNNQCAECARQASMLSQYGKERDPVINPQFVTIAKELDLIGNKHIPQIYLGASPVQRFELLAGLMDTDGSIDNRGRCEFSTTSEQLKDGVIELLHSLGYKTRVRTKKPKTTYKGEKVDGAIAYSVTFTAYAGEPVFKLPRKVEKLRDRAVCRPSQTTRRHIVGIEPVESVPVRCIQVDSPNHLFLAGRSLIPTHNTDSILNWQLFTVVCDPADMILYQTSQSVARDFSRRRVDRLHRHSPEVGKRVMRRSDADNTFDKHYTSGMIYTLSWPTINELSGRPVGRVALTDYDRMPPDIDGEGSPFDLARKRTTTFGSFAMTFVESSPGYSVTAPNWMPQSKHDAPPAPGILSLYNRGDRRRWYWPCPHCGEYYEPSFGLLKWPDSKDIMECAEGAQMMCPHCGTLTAPSHKYDLNLQGKWLAEGQTILPGGKIQGTPIRSDIASFWLKGPAASFASWQTLVSNYLKAEEEFSRTGSQDALRSTVNTDQGEPYFERGMGSSRAPEDLKARAEDIGDDPMVPADVRFLLATIDVQANRWEVQVHGVVPPPGEGGQPDVMVIDRFPIIKSKRVDDDGEHYWVKPGTYIEDWDLITEQVLQRTYPLADGSGRRMMIKLTGCDSGGKKGVTSAAYAYWRNLRKEGLGARFLLVKGSGEPSAPRIQLIYPDSGNSRKGKRELAKGEIPVLMIQTDKVKDQLDNMLDRITPGGMIRFSDVLDDNFYTELTVEQKDMKGKWVNPRKYRNESWDLMVYVLALMSHLRVEYLDWDNPPGWAADWDKNDMIVGEQEENRFETKKKEEYKDLKSLAELLG